MKKLTLICSIFFLIIVIVFLSDVNPHEVDTVFNNTIEIYSTYAVIFTANDGSDIIRISYDGTIWINPNMPVTDVAKRVFELLDERFEFEHDKYEELQKEYNQCIQGTHDKTVRP